MPNNLIYEMTIEPFNYALVFGSMLGVCMVIMLESLVSNALTFVKGWRTS